ncbi:hypothetical protein CSUB01_06116 [Colletotrichum sublineola]|uniref:Uncharacterized protein n=1 Tax=Colletotrichum sublineola TaxID=1173701 RepID=A0A066XAM6_COLSU|nr:hypothetical protein CSUB01_06116 [Colletotrichum sublineola]
MAVKSATRNRVPVRDLPSWVPSVPPFEGEDTLDVAAVAADFLGRFAAAVRDALVRWSLSINEGDVY